MFGWTHEDAAIELAAFSGRRRVFSIAGGGCTALQLAAAGHKVTAVDINPAQTEYVRERTSGAAIRAGWAERLMARVRIGFPAIGWTAERVQEFLQLEDRDRQQDYWNRVLDTPVARFGARALLSPLTLKMRYAESLVASLPADFGAALWQRLARGFAAHPNRNNPYAWRMLTGAAPFGDDPGPQALRLVCAGAAEFLEGVEEASFDAFTLSNILDGASREYAARLREAVLRAAAPDAVVVTRSFQEPVLGRAWNRASEDRSLIWGMVDVRPVSEY
jgi:S-adenosylmethionine:diacylglycerol 3-amino-3-carboxypropyl transferase